MQNRRHERVRELLKRELSAIILREFPVSEVGLVTVNDVLMAGDLHSATVYISIIGPPEQVRKGLSLLQRHRKRVQGMIGHAVVLKHTPELRFVIDDSVARGNRVLQIMEELERSTPVEPA
jgi:ribosome-binding factor A